MAVYGKPHTNEMLITFDESNHTGYMRIYDDKVRPTPGHICSHDGIWIIKPRTYEDVRLEREVRYKIETDDLKRHYETDVLLGMPKDETDKQLAAWREKVNQIKKELPFPDKNINIGYYAPLLTNRSSQSN